MLLCIAFPFLSSVFSLVLCLKPLTAKDRRTTPYLKGKTMMPITKTEIQAPEHGLSQEINRDNTLFYLHLFNPCPFYSLNKLLVHSFPLLYSFPHYTLLLSIPRCVICV